MSSRDNVFRDLLLAHIRKHGWTTPARALATLGVDRGVSRQTVMVALRALLAAGLVERLGRGAYTVPGFAATEHLRRDLQRFVLVECSPTWIKVPSKRDRGLYEDFEQWRAHTPASLAKQYLVAHDADLPVGFFKREVEELAERGLLMPAEFLLGVEGYFWATPSGRRMAEMLA